MRDSGPCHRLHLSCIVPGGPFSAWVALESGPGQDWAVMQDFNVNVDLFLFCKTQVGELKTPALIVA